MSDGERINLSLAQTGGRFRFQGSNEKEVGGEVRGDLIRICCERPAEIPVDSAGMGVTWGERDEEGIDEGRGVG